MDGRQVDTMCWSRRTLSTAQLGHSRPHVQLLSSLSTGPLLPATSFLEEVHHSAAVGAVCHLHHPCDALPLPSVGISKVYRLPCLRAESLLFGHVLPVLLRHLLT